MIEGNKTLASPRSAVWNALNDPAFLQRAIPGCRSVARASEHELDVALTASVGPIKTDFDTRLQILDVVALQSYVLKGQARAGSAGSASGSVRVELSDIEGGTLMHYAAQTEVSGRVAQLGSRMIDGAARRFSEEFFANVSRLLQPPDGAAISAAQPVNGSTKSVPGVVTLERAIAGLAWKVGIACAIGSFTGTLAAWLLLR